MLLEGVMIVIDSVKGEVCVIVGGKDVLFKGFNCVFDVKRFIGFLVKFVVYLIVFEDFIEFNLVMFLVDEFIILESKGGKIWLL